jgi:hypothetical protein
MKTTVTMKIWKATLTKLRLLYALTGRPMIEILDRLISDELEKEEKCSRKKE